MMKPHITAVKAVIFSDNNVLLLKKTDPLHRIQWELPGGKLEEGEDYHTALIREVKEETGLNITIGTHLGNWKFDHPEKLVSGPAFLCTPTTQSVTLSHEHDDFKWVPVEKLEISDLEHTFDEIMHLFRKTLKN
jgi:8-oxo-dGTP diphosphatase